MCNINTYLSIAITIAKAQNMRNLASEDHGWESIMDVNQIGLVFSRLGELEQVKDHLQIE